jgi:hypothetical protein
MHQRKSKSSDLLYLQMLEDSFLAQKEALGNYKKLDLVGRVVKIGRRIKGYTLGFKLNQDTFCILFEITDLTLKGISQFIFHKFAQELQPFAFINVMDDSGLENLRKVKISYRPVKLVPSYIVQRSKNAE